MREDQTPIRVLECEGCGVFFSCNLTRNGVCDGIRLHEINDIGMVDKSKEVDLSTFTPKHFAALGINVVPYDRNHIYERIVKGNCFCNKCSESKGSSMCGKVETINWEHRPVMKFELPKIWVKTYALLKNYEKRFSLILKLKELNEYIATGKEQLADLKKETTTE